MLYSPTGVVLELHSVPTLSAGVTILGWWRPAAAVPAESQQFVEFWDEAKAFADYFWCGLDSGTLNFALELYNDATAHDEYDVATETAIAGEAFHLAIVFAPGGTTATLYVSDESHSMDVLAVATVTNTDFAPGGVAWLQTLLNADVSKSNLKVVPSALSAAAIRLDRDRWQMTATPWAHWPMDRRGYTQPQTHIRDVSGNNRHLENPDEQGLGADVDEPEILRYSAAGAVRKVIGSAATVSSATTTIDVAVPSGAYTSGNDVVSVNDALILMLVHKGASYATVPAEWTLVQRGVQGTARLEVYRKNYGMVDGVPTAEVSPVAITGVAGAIGRIVAYGGMEHADALEVASAVKTGDGVQPNTDPLDTGDDWRDGLLQVAISAAATTTADLSDRWEPVPDDEDDQADKDMDAVAFAFLFETAFASLRLSAWDAIKISHGETYAYRQAAGGTTNWITVLVVLKPHDQRFARRVYYSLGRTGLQHTRTTDFPSEAWDDYYYSPGAFSPWAVFSKLERRKDRCGTAIDDEWTSNEEVDVAWHEYVRYVPAGSVPDVTRLKVNYYPEIDENYDDYGTADVTVRFRARVFLTTSLTDLSEASVLVAEWVSGAMFARGTRAYITENMELPAFTTAVPCWLVVVWGIRFEDIPTPTPRYPSPEEWTTAKNLIGAGKTPSSAVVGDLAVGRNDGPESGNKDGYAPWVEWSEHFLEAALPAAPANQTRATATVIPPGDVPNWESGFIDTRGATSPSSAIWFSLTPEETQAYIFHTFGSTGQAVVRVFNAAGDAAIEATQSDDDDVGILGCVSWWRGVLTGGVTYLIQARRGNAGGVESYAGMVHLTVEHVLTPIADDIFIPAGNGNTIMVWRDGRLVNIAALGAPGWVAGGVAIDYTERPMKDYRFFATAPTTTHSGHRLVVGLKDTDVAPGNDFAVIVDLFTLNPNELPIDYIFWGLDDVDPFGLSTIEIDQAGKMFVGSFGAFLKVAGATTAYEDSIKQQPADAAILAWDLLDAWYQHDFDERPTGSPELYPAAYDQSGTNFIRLAASLDRLLYTSSGFYTPVGGTKVKAITTAGVQLSDVTSPITAGSGPNPGPKGICPLPDGGYLLCNGSVVQRYNSAGTLTQTYTPTGPTATTLTDVDLQVDRLHFWCYDTEMSRFYRFNLASGTQVQTFPTFTYPGSSHSFVVYRPDRFEVEEAPARYRRKWLRRATHLSDKDRQTKHHAFELDMETGVGNDDALNPRVMLRWSDDGGHTWSHEHWRTAGVEGDFGKRVRWQRLGQARDRVYEVSGSDPVKIALIDAYIQTSQGTH